jgi:hypothetical protein
MSIDNEQLTMINKQLVMNNYACFVNYLDIPEQKNKQEKLLVKMKHFGLKVRRLCGAGECQLAINS